MSRRAAGYANGQPILVTSQGTYRDMYLQGYGPGMEKKWEIVIKDNDGPRASHVTPVWDMNGDGVDELLWGERILSIEDGHEVCCLAPDYCGHSDILTPFEDYKTGKMYLFTCREGGENGDKRVQVFNLNGGMVWKDIDHGHMHTGWVATLLDDYRKLIMVKRIERRTTEDYMVYADDGEFYYDAYTGEPMDWPFQIRGSDMIPIDFNGDGYHELLVIRGDQAGTVFDRHGEVVGHLSGHEVRAGRLLEHPGEQIMLWTPGTSVVNIVGDAEAVDGDIIRHRHEGNYHSFMQKLMASGYNAVGADISAGI